MHQVYCPDILGREIFDYSDSEYAYEYFTENIGFDVYQKINELINKLKLEYQFVAIIGFSIGATIAWKCSENGNCDGAICCYGSRIRDYIKVIPKCPTLLIFAKFDSFSVINVSEKLRAKDNVIVELMDGKHGFIDPYGKSYSENLTHLFELYRTKFLADCLCEQNSKKTT